MSAPLIFTVELSAEQLDALAERVAAILRAEPAPTAGLVDAQTVADALGVSRDTIYARAEQLGGRRIGNGERPRWRFNLADALAAWQPSADSPPIRAPRRRRSANGRGLLPIHGEPVRADNSNDHHNDRRIERL